MKRVNVADRMLRKFANILAKTVLVSFDLHLALTYRISFLSTQTQTEHVQCRHYFYLVTIRTIESSCARLALDYSI